MFQVTVPLAYVPPSEAVTNEKPVGSVSASTTPVALALPMF